MAFSVLPSRDRDTISGGGFHEGARTFGEGLRGMDANSVLEHNRVILLHFDGYSAASLFARFGSSVLMPRPLPEGASAIAAPADIPEQYSPDGVMSVLVAKYGLSPTALEYSERFQEWMTGDTGPIRIHLVRFTTFEAPRAAIEPHGGVFKAISEMRGVPMVELNLLRHAFNLVMGGG